MAWHVMSCSSEPASRRRRYRSPRSAIACPYPLAILSIAIRRGTLARARSPDSHWQSRESSSAPSPCPRHSHHPPDIGPIAQSPVSRLPYPVIPSSPIPSSEPRVSQAISHAHNLLSAHLPPQIRACRLLYSRSSAHWLCLDDTHRHHVPRSWIRSAPEVSNDPPPRFSLVLYLQIPSSKYPTHQVRSTLHQSAGSIRRACCGCGVHSPTD
ncbi:hypothetical protein C8T65DRAFT_652277 [Cerioporus squamosus]|nr:hypothetical protein C8T65DRAFT_652277 [Cerioporus squamosus]